MSHFTVLVIGENQEQQLAPFQENNMGDCPKEFMEFQEDEDYDLDPIMNKKGRWHNPNSKWDWYTLGGRWTGFFKVKEGVAEAVVGSPGLMTAPAAVGYADMLVKGDIDFEGMRNDAADEAAKEYDLAMKVIAGTPIHEPWSKIGPEMNYSNEARQKYHAQPRVIAWEKADRNVFGFLSSPDKFLVTREEFIQNAKNSVGVTHAIIKDGKWYERGEMGWWGFVGNEKPTDDWNAEFSKLIDGLSEDTVLSVFDCHV